MYEELNERIERTSKIFHLLLVKWSSLGCMIPPLIASFVKFYILHLDPSESFLIPFPTVYVIDRTEAARSKFNSMTVICKFCSPQIAIQIVSTVWIFAGLAY